MKKNLLILLFIISINFSFSQAFTFPFKDAPGLDTPGLYNGAFSLGLSLSHRSGDNSQCSDRGRVIINFDHKIDYTQDYTFGDSYYTLKVEVYGYDTSIENAVLIKTIDFDLSDFTISGNNYYYSTGYFDLPTPYYKRYAVKPIMDYFVLEGFPDLMFYNPNPWTRYIDNTPTDVEKRCDAGQSTNDEPSTDPNAQPNLTLSGFTVRVGSTTYDTFGNSNNIPEFVNGEEHEFNITIENDDEGDASSSNYLILVSEERVYPNIGSKPVYEVRRDNIGSIKGNSEKTDSFFLFINDFISSLRLENGKTYYLIVDIDHNGAVDESNENGTDNIFYIQFTFKSTTGKIRIVKDLETFYVDYNHSQNTSNILKLTNLNSGAIVYQKTLSSNKETVNLPSTTQSGLYGIYVNDKYIKKIGIGSDINNPNNPVLLKPIGQ